MSFGKIRDEASKEAAKEDYCSGKYATVEELAAAHKIPIDTVWKWIRTGNWRESRAIAAEIRQKKMMDKVGEELSEIDAKHYKGFDAIFGLMMKRMAAYQKSISEAEARGDVPEIASGDLTAFAAVMEKVQKGQRLAAGLDKEEKADKVLEILLPDFGGELRQALKEGTLPKAIDDEVIEVTNGKEEGPD